MKIFIRKLVSYAIDYAIVMGFVWIFVFCAGVFYLEKETQGQSYLMILCAFITVLFFTTYLPTRSNGQSIGQKIMKIRVVNWSGKDRTYLQSFVRECVVKVSAAPFFVVFAGIYYLVYAVIKRNPDAELPHDVLLKTTVVPVDGK